MPCYHPISLHRDRKLVTVGCGQCIGCRLERSREWAVRCMHEASLYEANAFVTLTYAPEYLPAGGTLDPFAVPMFMRRLRKRLGKVRYFACGEYGELCGRCGEARKFCRCSEGFYATIGRPHYHAILFGVSFPDRVFEFTSDAGEKVFSSEILSEVWPLGQATSGDVTFESAAYVARYTCKKVHGRSALRWYWKVDRETGEMVERIPERSWMSLKPGIGQGWLQRYIEDVYPSDEVVVRGHSGPVPRYYDKLLELGNPLLLERLKVERVKRAAARSVGDIPTLKAEEIVKQAQVGFLKREL